MASFRLVAIAKNEGANLPFWIFHHLLMGFDSIDLYVNNTTDNSIDILDAMVNGGLPIRVIDGDVAYREARDNGEDFQFHVYRSSLQQCSRGEYICFLDLDEFLVGPSLFSNIRDIECIFWHDFASVSFRWMIDLPAVGAAPFSPVFSRRMPLKKGFQFKSIGLVDRVGFLNSHMFSVSHGSFGGDSYRRYYSSGVPLSFEIERGFEGLHPDLARSVEVDRWFVLHRINGSECEYLASLLRGRGHKGAGVAGHGDLLKNNRNGYQDIASCSKKLIRSFLDTELSIYYECYSRFLSSLSLGVKLDIARGLVRGRAWELQDLLFASSSLVERYQKQLSGTRFSK